MTSGYRSRQIALRERIDEHRLRLAQLDEDVSSSPPSQRLPRDVRGRLGQMRQLAEPSDDSVSSLVAAERAADEYEDCLDEALGLGAELGKWVEPLLPRKEVVARWSGFVALSLAGLMFTVHELGLGDFMMAAVGVNVQRLAPDLVPEPFHHATAALRTRTSKTKTDPGARETLRTLADLEVEVIVSRRSQPDKP